MKISSKTVNQNENVEGYVPDEGKKTKIPEKQQNEVEICNLPENEFKIMIVKMIQDLGERMEKMQ